MYEVKFQQFSGPLDKLLELIELKKLEITAFNLAQVTADFIKYCRNLQAEIEPALLADFLVVAAKLVLIKSKTLLPDLELTEEEKVEIKDLESRLTIYKEFSARSGAASRNVNKLWARQKISYSRPLFWTMARAAFYPAPNLTVENLTQSINNLIANLKALIPETAKIKIAIVSLEEKIQELLKRCEQAVKHSFHGLLLKRSRSEIVVMFLAMLHLFKEKLISVEQDKQFGDIIIKKMTN